MDASRINVGENPPRLKVSFTARLLTTFAYSIPVIGGALSSLLLIRVMQALAANESAGVMAVMGGLKEASLPVIVSFYLAALLGLVVIVVLAVRAFTQTKTATPSSWFFVISGILCLLPAALFWRAKWMIIEALSPGSSISASGMASVGAEVSQWLILSVIAAPIVIVILIILAVLPLSSRSGPKWFPLIAAILIEGLLIASAVALPLLINEPKRKNEAVTLPTNFKSAEDDYNITKETSMVLTLTADNKMSQRQNQNLPNKTENTVTKEELPARLKSSMQDKTPDNRIVYLKCDVNATYENVLQVFDIIRKSDIDKVGLVVIGEKNEDDPYQISPRTFEVKLPEPPNDKVNVMVKPNPLTLVAVLETDGKLRINSEDVGNISDSKKLEALLGRVFNDRESEGVFREGTNEVEKTVFIKVSKSSKYGDFIKLVNAVKIAGAQPIGIQIDEKQFRAY